MYYDKKLVPHMNGRPVSPGFVNTPVAPAVGSAVAVAPAVVAPVASTVVTTAPTLVTSQVAPVVSTYTAPVQSTTVVQEVASAPPVGKATT